MGWLSLINDMLDENSDNSLEKRLSGAIDKVESTLNTKLDRAETGLRQASDAVDKLDASATQLGDRLTTVGDVAKRTIDGIQKKA